VCVTCVSIGMNAFKTSVFHIKEVYFTMFGAEGGLGAWQEK